LNIPTNIVLRHRRENLKKCSLRGLEPREDIDFYTYPRSPLPDLSNHILLTMEGPELSIEDASHGLFLIDGTWKYAEVMYRSLKTKPIERTLPRHFLTAYPRKQTECIDPTRGLASVEALYLAYMITKRDTKSLLDHYYWKDEFLKINNIT